MVKVLSMSQNGKSRLVVSIQHSMVFCKMPGMRAHVAPRAASIDYTVSGAAMPFVTSYLSCADRAPPALMSIRSFCGQPRVAAVQVGVEARVSRSFVDQ